MRALLLLLLLLPGLARAEAVRASRQMIATANPAASAAGLEMLRAGGSAMDAAIAAQAVLSLVEPHASGLFSGGLLLVWDPAARRLLHWDGVAQAPAAATPALPLDTDGARLPPQRRAQRPRRGNPRQHRRLGGRPRRTGPPALGAAFRPRDPPG